MIKIKIYLIKMYYKTNLLLYYFASINKLKLIYKKFIIVSFSKCKNFKYKSKTNENTMKNSFHVE